MLDDRFNLTLFAAEPHIVTPIGAAVDGRGRLLVIESHTHFPPAGYPGPAGDRIRILEDTDGDGRADRFESFAEGLSKTMGLLAGHDGWVYVVTRMEIFRLRDSDGDDAADEREGIARLETEGDYPHNGLCGLAWGPDDRLVFGLGENLGKPYVLHGSDGQRLMGGGEGGNIYQCDATGHGLQRLATGFWNPFGICLDPAGNLFTVENDPDASPPCRLIHVIESGDYGFQFRYGRSGRHPLQAWNGELPGTLPMVAGTGEAPCAVLPYDGGLWVTSWGDHRLERFELQRVGTSFQSIAEPVVQGDETFRPVGLVRAPDDSLYCTDWVDRSYPVHGRGRIWRLALEPGRRPKDMVPPAHRLAAASPADRVAARRNLVSADLFLRQRAIAYLARGAALEPEDYADLPLSARLGWLQALRWQLEARAGGPAHADFLEPLLAQALRDPDPRVRLYAVRWIADDRRVGLRSNLDQALEGDSVSPALLSAVLAAAAWLDSSSAGRPERSDLQQAVFRILGDKRRGPDVRAAALRKLSPSDERLTPELLADWALEGAGALQRESVRTLVIRRQRESRDVLQRIVDARHLPAEVRADAVLGLALAAPESVAEMSSEDPGLTQELERVRRRRDGTTGEAAALRSGLNAEQWLESQRSPGDPEAGWRIFFDPRRGRCFQCHAHRERGRAIGPDLTRSGQQMSRTRLLESILDPSREIAPRFVPWILQLEDGRVRLGLPLGPSEGNRETFLQADGTVLEVPADSIETLHVSAKSIMPDGIVATLDDQELLDLLAFLAEPAEE